MSYLKQSTTVTILMGPFVDKTDGVSEETGLTPGIEVSKAGGSFASRNSATAVAHDAEGWYTVELDSTDTNTLGRLVVKAHDSANHLPVYATFTVIPANVYDAIVAGSDKLQTDAVEISSSTSAADSVQSNIGNLDAAISSLNDPTAAAIANAVLQESVDDHKATAASLAEHIDEIEQDANNLDATISSRQATLTASDREAIADAILARRIEGGANTGRTVDEALMALRNRVELDRSAGTFTVYEDDDTTIAFQGSLSTATGNPISAFNPN